MSIKPKASVSGPLPRGVRGGWPADGWIGWTELEAALDTALLTQLRPHLTHTGLDGLPCIEAERLQELLGLRDVEGGSQS